MFSQCFVDHYSLLRISLFVSVFRASHLNAGMLFAIKKSSLQNALCVVSYFMCVHLDQQKIDCEQSGQAVQSCKTQQQPMVMMEQVGTRVCSTGKRPTTTVLLVVTARLCCGTTLAVGATSTGGFRLVVMLGAETT